jgi:hypothetical protein
MKRWLFALALFIAPGLCAQSINGVPNQVMSGFAPGVSGAPIIATANNYLNNTAAITTQVECTTTVCGAGEYLAVVSLSPTATATLGTISLTLSFTDAAQTQTVTAINALSLTTKTPAAVAYPFWSTGAANITWSTTVAAVTGSYSYNVYVRIIKLS